jgi:hypothetical protein
LKQQSINKAKGNKKSFQKKDLGLISSSLSNSGIRDTILRISQKQLMIIIIENNWKENIESKMRENLKGGNSKLLILC